MSLWAFRNQVDIHKQSPKF